MALRPNLSRAMSRICVDALKAYAPTLSPEGKSIAQEAAEIIQGELDRADAHKARRGWSEQTNGGTPHDQRNDPS